VVNRAATGRRAELAAQQLHAPFQVLERALIRSLAVYRRMR
jgi:hypothetical protein